MQTVRVWWLLSLVFYPKAKISTTIQNLFIFFLAFTINIVLFACLIVCFLSEPLAYETP